MSVINKKNITPKKIKFLEKIIDEVKSKETPVRASVMPHSVPAWGWGRDENNDNKEKEECEK
jgi:cob(I)alamin adenosyltransferase